MTKLTVIKGGPDRPRVPVLRPRADIERALELLEQAEESAAEAAKLLRACWDLEDLGWEIRQLQTALLQAGEIVVAHWITWEDEVDQVRRENDVLLRGAEFVPRPEADRVLTYGEN